jgi:hypothetical protein
MDGSGRFISIMLNIIDILFVSILCKKACTTLGIEIIKYKPVKSVQNYPII